MLRVLTAALSGEAGREEKKKERRPFMTPGNIVRARAYLDNCRFHRGIGDECGGGREGEARRQILNSDAYAYARARARAYRCSRRVRGAASLFRQLAGQAKIHRAPRAREEWTSARCRITGGGEDGHAKANDLRIIKERGALREPFHTRAAPSPRPRRLRSDITLCRAFVREPNVHLAEKLP